MHSITDIFRLYEDWTGQVVNKAKLAIFFSKSCSRQCSLNLLRITSYTEDNIPTIYLGVPIISGRLKIVHFDELITQIRSKIDGWMHKLLSSGSRLMLIQHVLNSILIHLLSSIAAPKLVFSTINHLFSSFFLGSFDGKNKRK